MHSERSELAEASAHSPIALQLREISLRRADQRHGRVYASVSALL